MTDFDMRLIRGAALTEVMLAGTPEHAEISAEELAKLAQNPSTT